MVRELVYLSEPLELFQWEATPGRFFPNWTGHGRGVRHHTAIEPFEEPNYLWWGMVSLKDPHGSGHHLEMFSSCGCLSVSWLTETAHANFHACILFHGLHLRQNVNSSYSQSPPGRMCTNMWYLIDIFMLVLSAYFSVLAYGKLEKEGFSSSP